MLEKCRIVKNRIDVGALPKWAWVSSLLWMLLGNVSRKLSCARIASKCRSQGRRFRQNFSCRASPSCHLLGLLKLAAVWPTFRYSSHNFKVTSITVFLHLVI
jgi:hypothetical protein